MIGTLGKQIRMERLFGQDDRMVAVMFDHAIARGVLPGLENAGDKIGRASDGGPDAMSMQKGLAESYFPGCAQKHISLILKATSPSPYNKGYAAVLADIEEAVTYGADAIAAGCILGGKDQARGMEQAASVVKKADQLGIPVIGHFYPNGENIPVSERENVENVLYAARAGAEIGVDVLKIHHSGNVKELARIVKGVPAKVVLAGGSHGKNVRDYLQMAQNTVIAGAAGIAFGRAVWSYEDPAAFVQALKMIIHENKSVNEALEMLSERAGHKIE